MGPRREAAAAQATSQSDNLDQARDGDWLDKDACYDRTDEYVDILKRIWTAQSPVDHEGAYYRIAGASPAVQTVQRPRIPVYFGGSSVRSALQSFTTQSLKPRHDEATNPEQSPTGREKSPPATQRTSSTAPP